MISSLECPILGALYSVLESVPPKTVRGPNDSPISLVWSHISSLVPNLPKGTCIGSVSPHWDLSGTTQCGDLVMMATISVVLGVVSPDVCIYVLAAAREKISV